MTVVAAVDPSPAARPVVERALEQAKARDADLHLVHVFQPPAAVYPMQGMYLVDDEEMEKAQHELVWNDVSPILEGTPVTRAELRG
ncbi:MAG TPA: universal stress protein, partial [Acidimicrobiia bacterium]|nr:universal stress protein [Acidimicrobiia bacterium]